MDPEKTTFNASLSEYFNIINAFPSFFGSPPVITKRGW